MFGSIQSRAVISRLNEAGYEAVFVGGAVRDFLLGQQPTDIDIATAATPEQVKSVFSNTVDLGTEHGTMLVIEGAEPIEVTTYRTEGTYTDKRRPDEVQFVTSLTEDLKRRDFTINALAMTIQEEIVDPFGGREDLTAGIIRAVGDAHERFGEDALRIMRGVRFVSTLGFTLEKTTKNAMETLANTIQYLSVERIKVEMDKLFNGVYATSAMQVIAETGLWKKLPLYPESQNQFMQFAPFRTVMEGWAALMTSGAFQGTEVARAYKLSNKERLYLQSVQKLIEVRQVRMYSTNDYYGSNVEVLYTAERISAVMLNRAPIERETIASTLAALPIHSKKDLVVCGEHLLSWTGNRAGRWLGDSLSAIEQAVLHQVITNEQNAIKEWFLYEYTRKE